MHNYRQDSPAYIYWGSAQGFKESDRTVLPAYIASGVAVGDLNGDGLPDVVLANQGVERGMEERLGKGRAINNRESYIYWGDINGFPRTQIPDVARRTSIPTLSAADVAIGDFNGDKHPDLVFANNNLDERSIYVYWGDGKGNFSESLRQVLQVADSKPAATRRDIEVNTLLSADLVAAGNHNAIIFNGSARGLNVEHTADLPAENCLGLEASDLNGDGHLDLVLANAGAHEKTPPASTIYWGARQGFSLDRRTDLPTLEAKTVKAADLNQDGFQDLLFGNEDSVKDVPSHIYWGGPQGFAGYRHKDLQGFGVVGAGVADLNRDGKPDIVLVNHLSGFGVVRSVIYWGNKAHAYSSASATILDEPGCHMMYSIADLDDDGFPDLLMNHSGMPSIWWGSQSGYSAGNRTAVPVKSHNTATGGRVISFNIADLNRDGFLDIVCLFMGDVNIASGALSAKEKRKAKAVIVYGNENRFKEARTSSELPLSGFLGAQALSIADLNKDGQFDLIFPMSDIAQSEIWWGSASGYDPQRVTKFEANGAPHACVADLDHDGWLDVVFTSAFEKRKSGQPVVGSGGIRGVTQNSETFIYWGSPEGFKTRNEVESFTALDATVADLNRDGHLDIALTNYKSVTTRELPAII